MSTKKPKHLLCDCNEYKKNLSIAVSWHTFLFLIFFVMIIYVIMGFYFIPGYNLIDDLSNHPNIIHGSCDAAEYQSIFLKTDENFSENKIYQFIEKFKQCKRFSSFFQRFTKLAEYFSIKPHLTPAIQTEIKSYGSICYAYEIILPLACFILTIAFVQQFIFWYFLVSISRNRLQWDLRALLRDARILTLIYWFISLCQIVAIRFLREEHHFLFK